MPRPARSTLAGAGPLLACLALAACATPQQRCIDSVTGDLQVINALIAEAEVNLARGFGTREETVWVPSWSYCAPPTWWAGGNVMFPGQMCLDDQPRTVERPVAIDIDAERRKLAQLRQQREKLTRIAAPAVAQCQARYPS